MGENSSVVHESGLIERLSDGWYGAALKNGLQDAMAYRLEFLLEVLGYAAVPACVQIVLWYALYQVGGAQKLGGYSYSEMVSYTIASVLFSQVRGGNHDFDLQEMIRNGNLSVFLLRPVGVIEFVWVRGVAPKLFVAFVCLLMGLVAAPFFGFHVTGLLGGMLMALIGNLIHYQVGAVLASAAFYWEEAYSILMVKNLVVGLLSGEIIPLSLFPDSMAWLWKYTPFYLYVYGPSQMALGRWTWQEWGLNMGIGLLWLMGGWVAIRVSWWLGMRKYLSVGN